MNLDLRGKCDGCKKLLTAGDEKIELKEWEYEHCTKVELTEPTNAYGEVKFSGSFAKTAKVKIKMINLFIYN